MAKRAARDWIFQVNSVNDGSGTWLDIAEIKEFDDDPSSNEEVTDGTTFSSAGQYEGRKMQIGRSAEIKGFYSATGAVRDPGQARCEVIAAQVGVNSTGKVRMRHTDDTLWTVWTAVVSLTSQGGDNNAFGSFGAKFVRSGAATTAVVS